MVMKCSICVYVCWLFIHGHGVEMFIVDHSCLSCRNVYSLLFLFLLLKRLLMIIRVVEMSIHGYAVEVYS